MIAFHFDFNFAHFRMDYLKEKLRYLRSNSYDTIIWELENAVRFDTAPAAAARDAVSKEEFTKLAVLDVAEAICRLGLLYLLYVSPVDKLWTLAFLTFVVTVVYNLVVWLIANKLYHQVTPKKMFIIITNPCQYTIDDAMEKSSNSENDIIFTKRFFS